jgi:hypothetical protein
MSTLLGLGFTLTFIVAPIAAQAPKDDFLEISSRYADTLKLLGCATSANASPSAFVYLGETKHFAGFHEGSVSDGRITGTADAVVTAATVTWKEPGIPPGGTEESFSLDRKTGALDAIVTYPAPTRHLSLFCEEDEVFIPDLTPGATGKWAADFNPEHICYSGFPNGIHSSTPVRVYVAKVSFSNWDDKNHPKGLNVDNVPLNKSATAAFVSALTKEALEQRSDTKFVAADGPGDANLYANLEYYAGVFQGKDHVGYLANVDIGGMGFTGPKLGIEASPPGQRESIVSYWMEKYSDQYDVRTPGDASAIAFSEVAKSIVNGWTCSK